MLIIWKWEVIVHSESDGESESVTTQEDTIQSSDPVDSLQSEPITAHSVVFKVIGCTKEPNYQQVLKEARGLIQSGNNVPIKVVHETDNPYNAKAIAFTCFVGGKWQRIGYIVNEILDDVHTAFNDILKVEFAWIKFITDWSRSGPGFFAGVRITRQGRWTPAVMRASSTR